jgi:hypothetical protein
MFLLAVLLENRNDARTAASRRRRGAEARFPIGQTSGRQYAEVESPVNCSRWSEARARFRKLTGD